MMLSGGLVLPTMPPPPPCFVRDPTTSSSAATVGPSEPFQYDQLVDDHKMTKDSDED